MKSFKEFIKSHNSTAQDNKNGSKDHKIPAVILVPNYDDIKKREIEKEKKKELKESNRESIDKPYDTTELEQHLKNRYNDFTPQERENIQNYSDHSFHLNGHLLASHHLGVQPKQNPTFERTYDLGVMDNLLSRKPIGRRTTLFSGIGFDPRTQMSKTGHIHLPSYTSTSISPKASYSFAKEGKDYDEDKHMLRISASPHDTGAYIGTPSGYIHEREFVLPRNTTLRIHKSERSKEDPSLWIHHATIDNNIDPKNIERNPEVIEGLHDNFHSAFKNEPDNSEISTALKKHHLKKLNPNLSEIDIQNIVSKSDDPEVHRAIANNENAGDSALGDIAKKSYDPEVHRAIANHKNAGYFALGEISKKYNLEHDGSEESKARISKAIDDHIRNKQGNPYQLESFLSAYRRVIK